MKQGHILLEKPLNVPKQASLQPLVSADLFSLLPPFCFAQMYVNCTPKCFCLPDFSIKNDQKDAEFYPLVFLLSIDLAASELIWHVHRHQCASNVEVGAVQYRIFNLNKLLPA